MSQNNKVQVIQMMLSQRPDERKRVPLRKGL